MCKSNTAKLQVRQNSQRLESTIDNSTFQPPFYWVNNHIIEPKFRHKNVGHALKNRFSFGTPNLKIIVDHPNYIAIYSDPGMSYYNPGGRHSDAKASHSNKANKVELIQYSTITQMKHGMGGGNFTVIINTLQ